MGSKQGGIGVLLVFVALLSWTVSCTSKKKMVTPPTHIHNYEWVTAKMTVDVEAPSVEYKNVNGMLKMRRDSIVWISASMMMGMEMARVLITQDSVIVVNRMNQSYLAEPISVVETLHETSLPSNLREWQSLLLGNGNSDHVEIQIGPYMAKIRYSDIHWDEPTNFPIKINKNYERIKL